VLGGYRFSDEEKENVYTHIVWSISQSLRGDVEDVGRSVADFWCKRLDRWYADAVLETPLEHPVERLVNFIQADPIWLLNRMQETLAEADRRLGFVLTMAIVLADMAAGPARCGLRPPRFRR
jgi:hypothetical protein